MNGGKMMMHLAGAVIKIRDLASKAYNWPNARKNESLNYR